MKITAIDLQTRNNNRVNVSIDGRFRFSLDVFQLSELNLKVGQECDEAELNSLQSESDFGKVYGRALEYCLMRPRSQKEVRDYLYRKTRPYRNKLGELKPGTSTDITARVFDKLIQKNYLDDSKFAKFWVENRSITKGSSRRRLMAELKIKGVENSIIEQALSETDRCDDDEIQKIIAKKRSRYADPQKFMAYLARQGFAYDDIRRALGDNN